MNVAFGAIWGVRERPSVEFWVFDCSFSCGEDCPFYISLHLVLMCPSWPHLKHLGFFPSTYVLKTTFSSTSTLSEISSKCSSAA